MKIITLNTWGGRAGKAQLLSFLKKYSADTEIFCLQEIWAAPYEHLQGHLAGGLEIDHSQIMVNGLQEISVLLEDFTPIFHPHYKDSYGLLMLVKKGLSISNSGEIFVYKHKGYEPAGDIGNHARNIQFVTVEHDGHALTVINFHGLWNGKGKTDSDDRIVQSKKILQFVHDTPGNIVLCGDFNLLPDTESIRILESSGLDNLITRYGITSTRTSHYTKPEKFADYVFVSKTVPVSSFEVLPEEVSDHSALRLHIT